MPINNINFQLLVTDLSNNPIYTLNIENDVMDIDIKPSKILNKIVEGSYDSGVLQGISAIETGSKISFSIPMFSSSIQGVQDITEFWKTILNNSRNFNFYLLRIQDNIQYSRRMIPIDNLGYKSNFLSNAGTSKLNFQFIDNFYIGTEINMVIPEFSNIETGIYEINYESITNIQTQSRFEIQLNNNAPLYYLFYFYSITGTGINFNATVPINALIKFDGQNLLVSGVNFTEISFLFTGTPPDLLLGETSLVFSTSTNVVNFNLKYNPRIDL